MITNHKYLFLWGWCGFKFRRDFGKNAAAKMIFNWVLWFGIVEIQCIKNEAEQKIALEKILLEARS